MGGAADACWVTGGAGFLGSGLCHALAAEGARVVALDVMEPEGGASPLNLEGSNVMLVRGDIRDAELHSLCQGIDVLFNMAAQTSHMGGQRDPVADIAINAVAQVRLIGAMREAAPKATGGPRLHPPVLRPAAPPAGGRDAPGAAAGRQRRLQMGRASSTGCWSSGCSTAPWCRSA
jgi:NAD(P)-dependent dehydrogenase (short-subunit alcohol dehydrogenase family)